MMRLLPIRQRDRDELAVEWKAGVSVQRESEHEQKRVNVIVIVMAR